MAGWPWSFDLAEAEVLGERMTVFADRPPHLGALLDASRELGDRDYLVDGAGRRLGFAEHQRLVVAASAVLAAAGVGRADRVAILGRNRIGWVVAFWATVRLGAIAVGLNAWWSPAELAAALADCAPSVVVCDAVGRALRDAVLREGAPCDVAPFHAARCDVPALDMAALEVMPPGPVAEPPPAAEPAEDDPAVILYTSGTTGRAKGAVHTHRCLVGLVQAQEYVARSRVPAGMAVPPGRVLSTMPLFHVSGLHSGVVAGLASGAATVWLPGRVSPDSVAEVVERERCTSWSAVPTAVWRLLRAGPAATGRDLSTLRHIGGGGAPWTPALQQQLRAAFGPAVSYGVGYGLTESTGLATSAPMAVLLEHPDSVGAPVPTVQVAVRPPGGGTDLPDGEEGEICLRGPMVMPGYWRNPAATAEVLAPGRWLRTGDLGYLRDGLVYLASRRTDLILRGGENVYPAEVEAALEAHPGVSECAVVGIEDAQWGAVVCGVVVSDEEPAPSGSELAAHVATRLAAFKVPTRWVVRPPTQPLPRTVTGKLLRAEVLAELTVPDPAGATASATAPGSGG